MREERIHRGDADGVEEVKGFTRRSQRNGGEKSEKCEFCGRFNFWFVCVHLRSSVVPFALILQPLTPAAHLNFANAALGKRHALGARCLAVL